MTGEKNSKKDVIFQLIATLGIGNIQLKGDDIGLTLLIYLNV